LLEYAKQGGFIDFKRIHEILRRITVARTSVLRELTAQQPVFDLVVESAIEDVTIKRKVLSRLSELATVNPDIVIATNSMNLSVNELCKDLRNPQRLVHANKLP